MRTGVADTVTTKQKHKCVEIWDDALWCVTWCSIYNDKQSVKCSGNMVIMEVFEHKKVTQKVK